LSVPKLPATATFKRGVLPDTAVNIAYLATKEITPSDIVVQNVAGQASENINSYIDALYFAGFNGILQGGPRLTDKNLYVTDKFYKGDTEKPLYFVAKSRYYHNDWPIYVDKQEYTGSNITVSRKDDKPYSGSYIITLEAYDDYLVDGVPYPWDSDSPANHLDEIPYKVVVYLDTDEPLQLTYNKIKFDLSDGESGWSETLNPYPYFTTDTLLNVASALPNEPIYNLYERGEEYTVAVPAVEIADTRRFEYFYWQIKGKLGRATPVLPPANTTTTDTAVDYTTVTIVSTNTYSTLTPLPSTQNPVPVVTVQSIPSHPPGGIVNIGIYNDGSGYPANSQAFIASLQKSTANAYRTEFRNPLRQSHTEVAKHYGNYWEVKASEVATTSALDKFNILVLPVVAKDLPYYQRLDDWSKRNGHGLVFMFDQNQQHSPPANVSSKWGFEWDVNKVVNTLSAVLTGHPATTGELSPHVIVEPHLPALALQNPYSTESPIGLWFDTANPLKTYDAGKFKSLIEAPDNNSPSVYEPISGIYDERIAVMDPFSLIDIMGDIQSSGTNILNASTSNQSWPSFYGLDGAERTSGVLAGFKFFYNVIMYLIGRIKGSPKAETGGTSGTSAPKTTEIVDESVTVVHTATDPVITSDPSSGTHVIDTPYVPDIITWVDYETPFVRSWITTKSSLTTDEIVHDNSLFEINGKLMRKIFSGTPGQILQSFVAESNKLDFLSLGDMSAEIVIDNPDVLSYQDGNNYYVYTEIAGGVPFESGVAYPPDYIRSDHWTSRRKLNGGSFSTEVFNKETTTKQVLYVVSEQKTVTKTGTRKVPTQGEQVYATHAASWHIATSAGGGSSQQSTWTATGKEADTAGTTGTGGKEEKKITVAKLETGENAFEIWSKKTESDSSSDYAWVYFPEADHTTELGASGSEVSWWQYHLQKIGYFSGDISGKYDDKTVKAVQAFHAAEMKPGAGNIGPQTGGHIASVCARTEATFMENHFEYISTNNLRDDRSGNYGRRTTSGYTGSSFTDYIQIDFAGTENIDRFEIQGWGGPANSSFVITNITCWANTSTKIADVNPNLTVSPGGVAKYSFPNTITGVKRIYIHVQSNTAWKTGCFFWGMSSIQAYGPDNTGTVGTAAKPGQTITKTGTVDLSPGGSKSVTLPTTGNSGGAVTWSTLTATGSVTVSGSGASWTITDTRTAPPSSASGTTDSTTITAKDGVKTFTAKLPSTATEGMTAQLVVTADSSTTVSFYNGSSFISKSTSVSNLTGSSPYTIGVKANDTPTTTTGYKDETYEYFEVVWEDVTKYRTELEDKVVSTGRVEFQGQDPPPAYYAYKPYSVLQHDGRLNVRLYSPEPGLTNSDPWYPRISFGDFKRSISFDSPKISWQASYTSTNVIAAYKIPEMDWGFYGEYSLDYEAEVMQYLSPRQARTKRSPLLFNEILDGTTDIDITKNGSLLAEDDITDISKDGVITFATSIFTTDTITANYSTRADWTYLVGLNLNPYPGHELLVDGRTYTTFQKVGLPIYVYLLPSYCLLDGRVIPDSVETDVVNFTTNPEIFDTDSDYYNCVAILIGIVSCTAPVQPTDITLLDARSRGGGAEETLDTHFYDVDYFTDKSYPENGFLVIDVSFEDKDKLDQLTRAIEKNIASGYVYKIRWV
jgi:hypothetical protein